MFEVKVISISSILLKAFMAPLANNLLGLECFTRTSFGASGVGAAGAAGYAPTTFLASVRGADGVCCTRSSALPLRSGVLAEEVKALIRASLGLKAGLAPSLWLLWRLYFTAEHTFWTIRKRAEKS